MNQRWKYGTSEWHEGYKYVFNFFLVKTTVFFKNWNSRWNIRTKACMLQSSVARDKWEQRGYSTDWSCSVSTSIFFRGTVSFPAKLISRVISTFQNDQFLKPGNQFTVSRIMTDRICLRKDLRGTGIPI